MKIQINKNKLRNESEFIPQLPMKILQYRLRINLMSDRQCFRILNSEYIVEYKHDEKRKEYPQLSTYEKREQKPADTLFQTYDRTEVSPYLR